MLSLTEICAIINVVIDAIALCICLYDRKRKQAVCTRDDSFDSK